MKYNSKTIRIHFFVALFALLVCASLLFSSCSFVVINSGKNTQETADDTGTGFQYGVADNEIIGSGTTDNTVESKDAAKKAAEKAKKRLGEMPDFDFGGQTFLVATTSTATFATDGDGYYDCVLLDRDSMAGERFNASVRTFNVREDRLAPDYTNATLAGEYYADILSVPEYRIGLLRTEGLIRNLRSLPFWNTGYDYSDYAEEAAAGYEVYADIGAASTDYSAVYAVFYNRPLVKELGYDVGKLVSDGAWTWDIFNKISLEGAAKYGIAGQGSYACGDEYTDVVLYSGGFHLVDNTVGKTPTVNDDTKTLEDLIEVMCYLLYSNAGVYRPRTDATESAFYDAFGEEKLMFAIAPLSAMGEISARATEWGVLPIPKTDESIARYYAYTKATANVIAVPRANNKPEMTGVMINALNVASHEYLKYAYMNECLYNYLPDAAAISSLDSVLDSITFDFTFLYSAGMDHLAAATYGAVREARVSDNASITELVRERMDKANAELAKLFGEEEHKIKVIETEAEKDG